MGVRGKERRIEKGVGERKGCLRGKVRERVGILAVRFELENSENLSRATVAGWRSVQLQSMFDPEKLPTLLV